jgi:hypothetical protein
MIVCSYRKPIAWSIYTSLSSCGGVGGHHIYKHVHPIMIHLFYVFKNNKKKMKVQQYVEKILTDSLVMTNRHFIDVFLQNL